MKTLKFTFWKDGNFYLGFLNDYPDYQTQGLSREDLVNNLKGLLADLASQARCPTSGRWKTWSLQDEAE